MDSERWNEGELPLAAAQKVDEICGQFEREVCDYRSPQIEAFLGDATGNYRRARLRELLALELQHCRRRHISIQRESLSLRFPEDGDIVEAVWEEAKLAIPDVADSPAATSQSALDAFSTSAARTTDFVPGSDRRDSSGHFITERVAAQAARKRYILNCFHARGGMGEVFIADDPAIGRRVAIKQLRPERGEMRARFVAEARVTGQLEHPGVVPLYDVGHDDEGRPYYVMKFIEGCTLRSAIQDYHRSTKQALIGRDLRGVQLLQIFVQLCQTIAYAHSRGVIHRDLKPDNVMLGAFGETLVLDWGVAKARGAAEASVGSPCRQLSGGGSTATHAGAIVGSAPYISPEAAGGNLEEVNERSDVYLLGATLYEILTGSPPRRGTSTDELLEMARTAEPPLPRTLIPQLSRPLQAICLKALSRCSTDRYATAQELAEDVQRFLAGEPVRAYPEGIVMRSWRWCKRNRRALGFSALALAFFLCFAVAWNKATEVRQWRAMEQARSEVVRFRDLADRVHYFAAHTDPATENTPYYDDGHALRLAEQAFDTATSWGPHLEHLPLVAERERLREELYDLCLLTIQSQVSPSSPAASTQSLRPLFEQAALLQEPTQQYYELLREAAKVVPPGSLPVGVASGSTRTGALDHFVAAERLRRSTFQRAFVSANLSQPSSLPGELEEALHEYGKAIALDRRHYWSHFQRGRCLMALGRTAQAVEAFGSCIALRPDAPWGYTSRGLAAALNRDFDEALSDLNHVLSSHPEFLVARLNRGVVYWQMGSARYGEALADFKAVLDAPPDQRLIEAAFYRAQLASEKGDWSSGIADLNLVIAERPNYRAAYGLRTRIRLIHESLDLGVRDLNTLLALSSSQAWDSESGLACFARGRFLRRLAPEAHERALVLADMAERELKRALQQGTDGPHVFEELGATVELLGRHQEARQYYNRGIQSDPDHLGLRRQRGWLLAQHLLEFEQAAKDFEVVHAAEPRNPEGLTGLGYVAACRNLPETAEQYAMEAVLYGGGDYLTLHNVACIYARLFRNSQQSKTRYKSLAVQLLERDVDLWQRGGAGLPNALKAIAQDSELSVLDYPLRLQ